MQNRLTKYFAHSEEEIRHVWVNVYRCLECDCVHYEDEDLYQEHLAYTSDEGIYEATIEKRLNAIFGSV